MIINKVWDSGFRELGQISGSQPEVVLSTRGHLLMPVVQWLEARDAETIL